MALGAVKVDDVRALVAAAGLTTWEQLLGAVDALRALQEASQAWREDERDAVSVQNMHRAAVATARARVDAIRAGQVQS